MSKKVSTILLTLTLSLCLALSAAADGLFTEACQARLDARKALESKYGLTQLLQAYFNESLSGGNGRYTVVYYPAHEDLEYVLGVYTVRVNGGQTEASWSWEGQENPFEGKGLASWAWGRDQLEEIWSINRETSDMSGYGRIATNLAGQAGFVIGTYAAKYTADDKDDQASDYDPSKAVLSRAEAQQTALKALQAAYGLNDDQLREIEFREEDEVYDGTPEGEPFVVITCSLWDEDAGWRPGDGVYWVEVSLGTGLVQSLSYNDGVIGNG